MTKARRPRQLTAWAVGAVLTAVTAGALAPPAWAAPTPPADCPTIAPVSAAQKGRTGIGWTVVSGTTRVPFGVEILGVLTDGIAPGADLVMVKLYDLDGSDVIEQAGGMFSGISGSPVFVDGQLLGSLSYGFTLAPSPIGGLTPAADMIGDLGAGTPQRKKVALSDTTRRDLATEAGTAVPRGSLSPIRTPLGVSGLRASRLSRLQTDLEGAGLPLQAHAIGRAKTSLAAAPTARPVVGGNFTGVISYGDLTAAGFGSTTYVCGDRALAFGHPFDQSGASTLGANEADTLTIVKDDTFGAFKLANVGPLVGTVDQDRLLGIRADLDAGPELTPLTTSVKNLDTGRRRDAATQVTDQGYLAEVSAYGSLAGLDRSFDEIGDGRAWTRWTIKGTRAGGKAFTLERANRWASRDDLTSDPAFDVALAVDALETNDFEPVTISSVDLEAHVATTFQQLHVVRIEVAVNGGAYKTPKTLKVRTGDKLKVRVGMRPFRSTEDVTSVLNLTVPDSASGLEGSLSALGGLSSQGSAEEEVGDSAGCLLDGSGCENGDDGSLDDVIRSITSVPRNDHLVAELSFDSGEDESEDPESDEPGDEPDADLPTVTKKAKQPLTVVGSRSIGVVVR